jgi:hypothetical protein
VSPAIYTSPGTPLLCSTPVCSALHRPDVARPAYPQHTTDDNDDDDNNNNLAETRIQRDACVHSQRRETPLLLSLAPGVVRLVSRR